MYSQIVVTIYHYMAHSTGFRENDASKLPSQQNEQRLFQNQSFSCDHKTACYYLTIAPI